MKLKCIVCGEWATYVYFGKSLCEEHFKELCEAAERADKKIKEAKLDER